MVTIQSAAGDVFFEKQDCWVCKSVSALTTALDVTEGVPVRRLDAGEKLYALGEEEFDEPRGLSRMRVRAGKDDKEGYVTVKGSKGTPLVEPNAKYYDCTVGTNIEMRMLTGSACVGTLDVGETFEATDVPKTDTRPGNQRVRVRNLSNNAEGWLTMTKDSVSSWTPQYKCIVSTDFHDGLDSSSASLIRSLEVGEPLRALMTPEREVGGSTVVRVHLVSEKDGTSGFANVMDGTAVLLEPAVPK